MHVSSFVFVALLAHTHAEQPLSCKFSYDEALLEKMIRNEIRLEQIQAKVEATLDRVESTLEDIQETSQNMREEFTNLNGTTFAKVEEFMKDSTDVIDQQKEEIDRMSEDLQSLYTDIRQNQTASKSTPIIAFKATGIQKINPSVGEVLVFPKVLFNAGNGYDASNGTFTAPVDGLYLFTTQMCVSTNKQITASIMVEATEIGRSFILDKSVTSPCNTCDAIAEVKSGQNVLVKVRYHSGNLYTDIHRLVSFSGALLHRDN